MPTPIDNLFKNAPGGSYLAKKFVSDALIDQYSAKNSDKYYKQAKEEVRFDSSVSIENNKAVDILNLDELNAFKTNPETGFDQIDETTLIGERTIRKLRMDFRHGRPYLQALNNYNVRVAELNHAIQVNPQKISAQDLVASHKGINKAVRNALIRKQDEEYERFQQRFTNDPVFATELATSTNATDGPTAKTKFFEDLDTIHKKQLEDLDNELKAQETKLFNNYQTELKQHAILLQLIDKNPAMLKMLEKLAPNNDEEVDVTINKDNIDLKGVRLNQFKQLSIPGGYQITKNEDGSYNMSIPNRIWGLFYHSGLRQSKTADMMAIAMMVRATGSAGIKMKINNFEDPEDSLEMARIAYQACREVGFDEENITIEINGESKKISELFSKEGTRKQLIETRAERSKAVIDNQEAPPTLNKESLQKLHSRQAVTDEELQDVERTPRLR